MRDGNRVQDSCNRLNWGARDTFTVFSSVYHRIGAEAHSIGFRVTH